ncbi:MAG: hypothetical protein ACPHER_02310 [Nevskiales bacterium]
MAAISVKNGLRAVLFMTALTGSFCAQADTTLTYQDQNDNGTQAFIISIKPPFLRMDEAGGMWMLYDAKADVIYAVQPAEKSYTRMDRAMAQQLGGVMSAVEDQLNNLPADQRAAIEQMMGRSLSKKKVKTEYVLTSSSRERAGVKCQVGHLMRDGKSRHEFCVAKPEAVGMSSEDYGVMTKMFELMGTLRETAASMFEQDLPDPSEMKGVAIESNGPQGGHQVLSKFNNDKLSADNFKLPADYRQEAMPSMTP